MMFETAWTGFLGPMIQRPKRLQVAALCHNAADAGKEFLLITSRDTGRWIIPKGWPIRGLSCSEAALQEAWEEAGVADADARDEPIGSYSYNKRKASGLSIPVETLVYSLSVRSLARDYPEAAERQRTWVSAAEAAYMVDEPELRQIFRNQAKCA